MNRYFSPTSHCRMMFHFTLFFLSSILLSQTAAASLLAQDAVPANQHGRLSAKYALLLLRQNVVYCAETYYSTYCIDSVCCGIYNCMPTDAECCANGQYCFAGTACEWQNYVMTCQCVGANCDSSLNSSPMVETAVTKTMTTTAAAAPSSTYTPLASTPTPSPSTENNSGGGKGLSSGTLAGIGSVAGIVSCVVAVWGCICYRKRHSDS